MERCETCKHFVLEVNRDFGSCERWHKGYGVKWQEVGEDEVLVEDDEGWAMMMGPKFGCVLHEPR
jgi:hypothetical protein